MTDLTTSYDGARPIEDFVPSKTNPRTHFPENYIADLKGTIVEKGVVEPLVARPHPKQTGKIEIVAGECRWRASKLAALTVLPVVIRNYSDEQVLEIQLIENLHRKDLTDLEQAAGYRKLIDTNPDKHSAASLASRIGMSVEWVWDTLSLNNLIPEAKQLLEEKRIARGHAVLIARQTLDNQKWIIAPPTRSYPRVDSGLWVFSTAELEFAKAAGEPKGRFDGLKPVSIRELESWINDHIRFDVEHAAKAQPMEFEATAEIVQQAAAEPGRGKKVIAITHDYRVSDDARDDEERTYGSQSWKLADGSKKGKPCEYSVLGLVVAGKGKGRTLTVCVNREKCKTHFRDSALAAERRKVAAAKVKPGKTAAPATVKGPTKVELAAKAKREAEERARDAWDKLKPLLEREAFAQLVKVKTLTAAAAKVLLDGELFQYESADAIKEMLGATWFKTPVAAIAIAHLGACYGLNDYDAFVKEVKALGVDVKKLAAIRDQHAPKSEPDKPAKKKAKK